MPQTAQVSVAQPVPTAIPIQPTPPKQLKPLYRIESSKRLKNLVNPNQRDTAAVGTYDPKLSSKTTGIIWSRQSQRFPIVKETISTDYTLPIPKLKNISSFQSKTKRFESVKVNDIAPGSYDLLSAPITSKWKPWVVTVSSRLGRFMDKHEKEPIGTVSKLLDSLSIETRKSEFIETKARIQQQQQGKQNGKRFEIETKAVTPTNPYSASFLVQSIVVPSEKTV